MKSLVISSQAGHLLVSLCHSSCSISSSVLGFVWLFNFNFPLGHAFHLFESCFLFLMFCNLDLHSSPASGPHANIWWSAASRPLSWPPVRHSLLFHRLYPVTHAFCGRLCCRILTVERACTGQAPLTGTRDSSRAELSRVCTALCGLRSAVAALPSAVRLQRWKAEGQTDQPEMILYTCRH